VKIRKGHQNPMVNLISSKRYDIPAVLLVLLLALGTRLLYQKESVVNHPVRADAFKYVTAAVNLVHFGVYSLEVPRKGGGPPRSRTDRSPGYPIFLSFFVRKGASIETVLRVQAVMGALASVFTFVTARLAMSLHWALFAGILTALCPHLIAMDHYLLTESLFTFVLMLGTMLLSVSWEKNRYAMTLLGGILIALSAHIRAVNLLFLLSIAPVFFFNPRERGLSPKSISLRHFFLLFIGFIIITTAHRGFVKLAVENKGGKSGLKSEHSVKTPSYPHRHVGLDIGWRLIKKNMIPPEFFARRESHVLIDHLSVDYKRRIKNDFWEYPFLYLKWNLGGKLYLLWHWDNAYNDDVYIYPMIRKGFEENIILKSIHRSMQLIHWPLYLLALAAPIFFLIQWRRNKLNMEQRIFLLPILGFLYFLFTLNLLSWLPRYTIPVRPLSYIMAGFCLSNLLTVFKKPTQQQRP
jgi:hypothetical protein